jgi:inhibitor of KinA sporulation pathway (predicted exonuclease)
MQHIFVDFEMNQVPRKGHPDVLPALLHEIVEIGAVKLDQDYRQVGKYSAYVRPQCFEISPACTRVTGIREEDVAEAKPLPEALEDFLRWIGEEPTRTYAWSDSDKKQLFQECQAKELWAGGVPKPFRRWMDFQRIYTRLLGLSSRNRISLKNAIGGIEVNFAGTQHSAADDAENSAVLLTLVHDKEAFEERTRITRTLMNAASAPPPPATTLGDLFGAALGQWEFADDPEEEAAPV